MWSVWRSWNLPGDALMPPDDRLRADCANCFGICCVVPAFSKSADFAIDKPRRTPCPHLADDFGCSVHDDLRPLGFVGCTVFDCFGAGQRVAQETFGGRDWRSHPEIADQMFDAYEVMRDLHELLFLLRFAQSAPAAEPLHGQLRTAYDEIDRLASGSAESLATLDTDARFARVADLLSEVSMLARAGVAREQHELRGADLAGRSFAGADLRGANLRGALLVGADFTGADLGLADLLGADFRGVQLAEADLGRSLFLTQFQVNAANGDRGTRLPAGLERPGHWRS